MTPFAALTVAGCLAVSPGADRITARDLAAGIPGLAAPDSDLPVAWAPAPGVDRVFRVPELQRLAKRLDWDVEPAADICFTRPVAPPDPARYLAAMRKSLPSAEITVLDYGRQAVPEGEIEFPAGGLHPGPTGGLWIGRVRYSPTRRFEVWARVEVLVSVTRVIAATDLRPGQAISPADLSTETRRGFPGQLPGIASPGEAVGQWPRAAIRAGTVIVASLLEKPKEVLRGDIVKVDVRGGAAHLAFEGRAEASGAVGEMIPVLNPVSNRRFPARVEGKGKVSVEVIP